jgi:hypothetical protein
MKIQITKIIRPIKLEEYATELKGQTVDVWVNPTRNVINTFDNLNQRMALEMDKVRRVLPGDGEDRTNYQKSLDHLATWTDEEYAPKLREWYAALWSQGENQERHWTPEELKELDETDPALFNWLRDMSQEKMREHRNRQKKS